VNESTIRTIRIVVSILFGLLGTYIGTVQYEAMRPNLSSEKLALLWLVGWPVTAAMNYFMMATWMDWRNRR